MTSTPSALGKLSPILVRLVALWVMTGAGYKLFAGSPNDLPPVVREFFLGADLTFRLAIAIELSIGFLTLLWPRVGWVLLALQLLVFLGILVQLVLSGEASCGCFGSKITIPPEVMMAIDGVGLFLVLITKPWATLPRKEPPLKLSILAVLASCLAPWLMITSTTTSATPNVDQETGEWRLPEKLPDYALLEPATWVGKDIRETALAVWMDVDLQVTDGTWILYRVGCEHCAEYLRGLYEAFDPNDPKFITLVRLSEVNEEESRQVDEALLPPITGEALLPDSVDWVITPPWRLELVGGVVQEAVFEGDFELESGAKGQ